MTSTEPQGERPGFDVPEGAVAGQEHRTAPEALAADQPLEEAPQPVLQTASQTVGPFFGFALPFEGGAELVPALHPHAVRLHGFVLDGAGGWLWVTFRPEWDRADTTFLDQADVEA